MIVCEPIPALSETRKADRAKMAAMLSAAMLTAGATSADVTPSSYNPQQLDVRIVAPGGAHIHVDFNGESSQPNVHVATWNTPDAVFLNPGWFGNVNPCHFGKATVVAEGIDNLIAELSADLEAFARGDAYLPHEDSRIVAMAAYYAAQGWADPRQPRRKVAA